MPKLSGFTTVSAPYDAPLLEYAWRDLESRTALKLLNALKDGQAYAVRVKRRSLDIRDGKRLVIDIDYFEVEAEPGPIELVKTSTELDTALAIIFFIALVFAGAAVILAIGHFLI